MKQLIMITTLSIFLAGGIGMYMGYEVGRYSEQKKIDLPEEYPLISRDAQHPDTMITFYRGNKLFFRFSVAARHYPHQNH